LPPTSAVWTKLGRGLPGGLCTMISLGHLHDGAVPDVRLAWTTGLAVRTDLASLLALSKPVRVRTHGECARPL
jgi:hypothetical protein